MEDTNSDNFLFIHTTNTTLNIHDVDFVGNFNCFQTSCTQNAIVLGGASTTGKTSDPDDAFQGYGTIISNNDFQYLSTIVQFGYAANGVEVDFNKVEGNCGSSTPYAAPFVFSDQDFGNRISGGIVARRPDMSTQWRCSGQTRTTRSMR